MKILLIEGDEAVRLGAAEILSMKGFEADTAASVDEALNLLAAGGYDVILSSAGETGSLPPGVKRLEKPFTAQRLINAAKGDEN